jgi:outer membrane murein-binding lipoprotein Lpp
MRNFTSCVVCACMAVATLTACSDRDDPAHASSRADELEQKVASLDNRFDALVARIKGDKLEAKYHDTLAALEERRVALEQRMSKLADRTAASWNDMKADAERAMDELEREIDALAKKLDAAVNDKP